MNHKIIVATISASLALGVFSASAEDKAMDASKLPPATSVAGVTYEKDIKAIFDKSCTRCHKGEKPKGKLNLETLDGILKGGKEGIVIKPGKSGESPLVYAVAHIGDEDDFMPPPHNKANIGPLTPEQIGLIRAWIDQGAK